MSLLENYQNEVALKYQVYNSIFLTLGLDGIHKTGVLMPILAQYCERGLSEDQSPEEIISTFLKDTNEKDQLQMLFRFVQFIERQIVLIDALEDAAYQQIHDVRGSGSYHHFEERLQSDPNLLPALKALFSYYRVRIILTAHPTQFYPGEVLGIITDLSDSIRKNDLPSIKLLLEQLGHTPFFKKEKPTPYDEAVSLIWYLESVFYATLPRIYAAIHESLGTDAESTIGDSSIMKLGFWPGGDRDGNPGVTAEITEAVADRLRTSLFRCYYRDIRKLKRKLTFHDVLPRINVIEEHLRKTGYGEEAIPGISKPDLIQELKSIESILEEKYNGLYANEVRAFRHKFNVFKYHFSALDVRQDSRVIRNTFNVIRKSHPDLFPTNFEALTADERVDVLFGLSGSVESNAFDDDIVRDTIASVTTMLGIQKKNGPEGAYRYIISNCGSAESVAEVYALASLTNWGEDRFLDIIPLFETINDLKAAGDIMTHLYNHPVYRLHLQNRMNKQVVMLGFSDGTKDGGYITANWGIYKAKEMITQVSREAGIKVVFFDGRGGPPARGGGNTHNFYASLGEEIESRQIQLTIQGQTISSNFGTNDSARFNVEQLLTAGLENNLSKKTTSLSEADRELLDEMSEISHETYQQLKKDPLFVPYLEEISPLTYYSKANIGSRPSKRGKGGGLVFEDLRAIPFVGAWSQLKQNVPGYYGVGSAIAAMDKAGKLNAVKALYKSSLFFRTLIENSMQSLSKTHFSLTSYLKDDPKFGTFWKRLYDEHRLAEKYVLDVSGQDKLLATNPSIKASIDLREQVVMPLLTIQQFALIKLRDLKTNNPDSPLLPTYEKLVIRTLYGNINASRNSA